MRAILASALVLMSSAAWAQTSGQPVRCPTGQVYNPDTRQCFVPQANQDLTGYYIGGALILSGVIGAIVLANNGSNTVSP
jgi:hypothetical protein